jgi:hypothetical protein
MLRLGQEIVYYANQGIEIRRGGSLGLFIMPNPTSLLNLSLTSVLPPLDRRPDRTSLDLGPTLEDGLVVILLVIHQLLRQQ